MTSGKKCTDDERFDKKVGLRLNAEQYDAISDLAMMKHVKINDLYRELTTEYINKNKDKLGMFRALWSKIRELKS